MKKLEKVKTHLDQKLKDACFRELYQLEQQKLPLVKLIVNYRIKHHLNQKQLAEKVGVSQQHISKIEAGDFSNMTTLARVLFYVGYAVKFQVVQLNPEICSKISKQNLKAA